MPVVEAGNLVIGRTFMNSLVAALATRPGGALITGGKLRLSKALGFNPTPDSTVADLAANEADYTGYAAGGYAVTVSAPVNFGTQQVGILQSQLFTASGPAVSNNVTGFWIDDGTNMVVAGAILPPTGVPFAQAGDYLELAVPLPFDLILSAGG